MVEGQNGRGAKRISTDVRLKTLGIISHHPTDFHVHASRIFLQPRVLKADPTVAYPGLQTEIQTNMHSPLSSWLLPDTSLASASDEI